MAAKTAPAHPKYDVMIKAAISSLKERNGSSVPAIAKYLGANYALPDNYKKTLFTQLKRLAKDGKLVKVKASFKLSEEFKKPPPKPKKKPAAKKPAAKKPKKPKKVAKKPAAKKAAAKKAAPKKSAKKPAAKKAAAKKSAKKPAAKKPAKKSAPKKAVAKK